VAGLFIPAVPIIASMADFAVRVNSDPVLLGRNVTFASGGLGYGLVRFPPLLCSPTNGLVAYYSIIFITNLVTIVGTTELILIFWTVHKVSMYNYHTQCSYDYNYYGASPTIVLCIF